MLQLDNTLNNEIAIFLRSLIRLCIIRHIFLCCYSLSVFSIGAQLVDHFHQHVPWFWGNPCCERYYGKSRH